MKCVESRKCFSVFGVGPTDRPKISRSGLDELATSLERNFIVHRDGLLNIPKINLCYKLLDGQL